MKTKKIKTQKIDNALLGYEGGDVIDELGYTYSCTPTGPSFSGPGLEVAIQVRSECFPTLRGLLKNTKALLVNAEQKKVDGAAIKQLKKWVILFEMAAQKEIKNI